MTDKDVGAQALLDARKLRLINDNVEQTEFMLQRLRAERAVLAAKLHTEHGWSMASIGRAVQTTTVNVHRWIRTVSRGDGD